MSDFNLNSGSVISEEVKQDFLDDNVVISKTEPGLWGEAPTEHGGDKRGNYRYEDAEGGMATHLLLSKFKEAMEQYNTTAIKRGDYFPMEDFTSAVIAYGQLMKDRVALNIRKMKKEYITNDRLPIMRLPFLRSMAKDKMPTTSQVKHFMSQFNPGSPWYKFCQKRQTLITPILMVVNCPTDDNTIIVCFSIQIVYCPDTIWNDIKDLYDPPT